MPCLWHWQPGRCTLICRHEEAAMVALRRNFSNMACLWQRQPRRCTVICRHGPFLSEEAAMIALRRNFSSLPCLWHWQPGRWTQICRSLPLHLEAATTVALHKKLFKLASPGKCLPLFHGYDGIVAAASLGKRGTPKNNGTLQNAAAASGSRRRRRLQSACHDNTGFTSSTLIQ